MAFVRCEIAADVARTAFETIYSRLGGVSVVEYLQVPGPRTVVTVQFQTQLAAEKAVTATNGKRVYDGYPRLEVSLPPPQGKPPLERPVESGYRAPAQEAPRPPAAPVQRETPKRSLWDTGPLYANTGRSETHSDREARFGDSSGDYHRDTRGDLPEYPADEYVPSMSGAPTGERKVSILAISNLPKMCEAVWVYSLLSVYGEVLKVVLSKEQAGKQGLVSFSRLEHAEHTLRFANGINLMGKPIKLVLAQTATLFPPKEKDTQFFFDTFEQSNRYRIRLSKYEYFSHPPQRVLFVTNIDSELQIDDVVKMLESVGPVKKTHHPRPPPRAANARNAPEILYVEYEQIDHAVQALAKYHGVLMGKYHMKVMFADPERPTKGSKRVSYG